jgi:CheY-like chemotaxis protein
VFVMLTSATRSGDVARCEELKVAAHLVKPVKQSELYDSITEALGIAAPASASAKPESGLAPMRPLRILLAEDSLANQKLAIGLLTKWGHRVTVAVNGQEAVAKATSGEPFDLVLMDVQMPEMDGFEATGRIRDWEKSSKRTHTPVIAMTAHAMKGDRERCHEAGMDGYVSKPIRAPELARTIAQSTIDTGKAEPAVGDSNAPAQAPSDGSPAQSSIDWPVALASVGDDRDLLKSVIHASLEEWPALALQLREAIQQQNAETTRRAIHTLKNAFRTLGAGEAYQCVERLDAAVRTNEANSFPLGELTDSMHRALRELSAFLGDSPTSPHASPRT